VKQILKTSCYNCHSNETTLSWFDEPTPAYWQVVRDVREGRKHLNFSEIGKLPPGQQRGILFESVSQIELGAMPLPAYKRLHPESVVTPEQLMVLKSYSLRGAEGSCHSGRDQCRERTALQMDTVRRRDAECGSCPNGIAFLPEYKNWKAISSTERFDNQTLRQILGNDVAVKAIAENHINRGQTAQRLPR